jgi:peptidoglycan/xylan/chitin deacetylase (PgdA/CDA1 family)
MAGNYSEIPIFTYHKITARSEIGINTVHPRRFAEQIQYLKEAGFESVTLNDLKSKKLPEKPVIITFDDGYSSVHKNALPILRDYNFKAVVFIITGYIGKQNTWDANLAGIRFNHLSASQIKDLYNHGMEVGSHGVTHRALTYLGTDQLKFELKSSRDHLVNLLEDSVTTIAYPFGIQDTTVQDAARSEGYTFGCINLWGRSSGNNSLCLKRIPVYGTDSLQSFKRKFFFHRLFKLEILRLRILSFPALLTPIYQKYRKNLYSKHY